MPLRYESYLAQSTNWPQAGRQILAQYEENSIVVYQAYRPAIGHFAARHGYFGGEFSFTRMSWIKTNFLWMMYRSGWGSKEGQEVTLAIHLRREAFDRLLAQAVHSHYVPELYRDEASWKAMVEQSSVRLQWDPDHDPTGAKVERRAVQLGLRGEALKQYAREWILEIEDISEFVRQQAVYVGARAFRELQTPYEAIYSVADQEVAFRIGIEPRI